MKNMVCHRIPLCDVQTIDTMAHLGPIVRYTPNRLIFNTAEAMRGNPLYTPKVVLFAEDLADIYGQGRNTQKSSGYAPHPYFPAVSNTHNCIDKELHGRKRRIVSQGFSTAAINSSEPIILHHVQSLCSALMKLIPKSHASSGYEWSGPQDMAAWSESEPSDWPRVIPDLETLLANYLTLDVISDLTYGQPFGLLTSPNLRWLVNAIVSGNRRIYLRFAFPSLFNVNPKAWYNPDKWIFPEMAAERQRFLEISTKYSEERMASEEKMSGRNDIMSALLAAKDPRTGTKLSEAEVWGEAHLMIAAGKCFCATS